MCAGCHRRPFPQVAPRVVPGTTVRWVPEKDYATHSAQISELIFEYSERIDAGDLEGVADLLASAGFGAAAGPLLNGRDKILAMYKATVRIYEDGTPRTKHLVTNVAVRVDPTSETASARSYFTVLQQVPEGPLGPIVSGRYRDRFVNHDGIWRFSERRIATDLVGDVSRHMLPGGPGLS
jgi:SnoaL-like domain